MMAAFGAALTVAVAGFAAHLVVRWQNDVLDSSATTGPARVPFLGGDAPDTHAWSRFHIRYYAMALLFLAFDMEMVFMYPWAVVFVEEGIVAAVEMGMFILILLLGVLYAWREKAFEWA